MRKEYIEREAAKRAIMWCEDENNFDFSQGLIAAEDTLDNIPAADVAPVRHGRWIEREDMNYGWNIWECSACREEFCVEEGTPKDYEYNYCPNCGARMDGDSNGV